MSQREKGVEILMKELEVCKLELENKEKDIITKRIDWASTQRGFLAAEADNISFKLHKSRSFNTEVDENLKTSSYSFHSSRSNPIRNEATRYSFESSMLLDPLQFSTFDKSYLTNHTNNEKSLNMTSNDRDSSQWLQSFKYNLEKSSGINVLTMMQAIPGSVHYEIRTAKSTLEEMVRM